MHNHTWRTPSTHSHFKRLVSSPAAPPQNSGERLLNGYVYLVHAMYGGRGFRGFVVFANEKMEILYTFYQFQDSIQVIIRYEGCITSNLTHIILYCILKAIGVASAHSLVPPYCRALARQLIVTALGLVAGAL